MSKTQNHLLRQLLRGETQRWFGRVGWGQGAWAKGGELKAKVKKRAVTWEVGFSSYRSGEHYRLVFEFLKGLWPCEV
jgi:hypothetical protein